MLEIFLLRVLLHILIIAENEAYYSNRSANLRSSITDPFEERGLSGGSAKDACTMADLFVMTDNSRKLYANKFSGTN